MLTRCPACSTVFRLSTEQLVSRHGRVRCGNCAQVFSALDHLVTQPDESDADAAAPARSYDLFADSPAPPSVRPSGTGDAAPAAAGSAISTPTDPPHASLPAAPRAGTPAAPARSLTLLAEPPPRRSWIAVVGCGLTVVGLVAQGAWFHKDLIAAWIPESRPILEAACATLGCRVDVPIDALSISIESSDLQADPATRNLLALTAIVRNRAAFAQPTPHLELALTDAQEAALVRKVLGPADYAPGVASIDAGAEVTVKVWIDAMQVRASGYRLYAFYP